MAPKQHFVGDCFWMCFHFRYQALQKTVRQCYGATKSLLTSPEICDGDMKELCTKFSCWTSNLALT